MIDDSKEQNNHTKYAKALEVAVRNIVKDEKLEDDNNYKLLEKLPGFEKSLVKVETQYDFLRSSLRGLWWVLVPLVVAVAISILIAIYLK